MQKSRVITLNGFLPAIDSATPMDRGVDSHTSRRRFGSAKRGSARVSALKAITAMTVLYLIMWLWNIPERHDWGVVRTNHPQKVAIVYRFHWLEGFFWRSSLVSIHAFSRQTSLAGHNVDVVESPNEDEFIRLLNKCDVVFIIAHGAQAWFKGDPWVQNPDNRRAVGIQLGGTLSGETAQGVDDREIAPCFVTPYEVRDKIDNPNLIVVVVSCGLGACDAMYTAIKPRIFVAPTGRVGGEGIRAAWEYTVSVLNGSDPNEALTNLRRTSPLFKSYGR
jgi:hypothetical protein